MFDQELERLSAITQSRTIGSRGSVTLQEILAADIPASIQHYFRHGVEEKFFREWKETEAASRFPYQHPSVKKIKRELQSSLTMNYVFSRKEFLDALDDGIHLMLNYLIRPQWTLASFVFNSRETIDSPKLMELLNGFYEYEYIREITKSVIEKSKMTKFSQEEFRLLLQNLDYEYARRRNVKELAELTQPMYRYFSIGGVHSQSSISTSALIKFFDDKNLSSVSSRLHDAAERENAEQCSSNDLQKYLEEVYVKNGSFVAKPTATIISKREEQPKQFYESPVIAREEIVEEKINELEEEMYSTSPTEEEVLALLKKPQTSNLKPPNEEFDEDVRENQDHARSMLMNKANEASKNKPLYDDSAGPLFEVSGENVVKKIETQNGIRALISERMKKKFIKKIFKKEESLYEQEIDMLEHKQSWSEAARHIGDIFIANEIDPYSSIAVKFTEIIHSRFRK
ncbi:MAG: hypothetical protein KGZ58_02090 [Ignavibacteriales bacterium]|nr:hypothetical protein [Ignavibacteriales bacterium]